GAGGMGTVFEAYDPRLGRRVALKLVRARSDAPATRGEQLRLLAEAQALARVSHPNVVQVFDVGEHEGLVYISMELIVGATLTKWLRRCTSWRAALPVLEGVARGLTAAHSARLVHRDVKPENVLISESRSGMRGEDYAVIVV